MARQVIITIPIYQCPLTDNEKMSLKYLIHFLGDHELTLVAPRSLDISDSSLRSLRVTRFADDYFDGIAGYNKLMLSREFYDAFQAYEYILIYQLDCLVFAKDLAAWCDKGWDYVGAPWFKGHRDGTSEGFWAVGNGGLSLRRVSTFRKVLRSRRLLTSPFALGRTTRFFPASPGLRFLMRILKTILSACGYRNTMRYFVAHFQEYEDLFWSFHAKRACPDFKIPTPKEALPFAFEYAPRYCFEQNSRQLPFGCHAWHKTDPAFWQEVLATQPDTLLCTPDTGGKCPTT